MLQCISRGRTLWFLALLSAGGCQSEPATSAPAPAAAPAAQGTLVVFAAASLRDAFGSLKSEFGKTHPNLEISFNFAGTQDLRVQLEHGAPVDVFASADRKNMNELEAASRVTKPAVFARNEPVIVVAREHANAVTGLADLPQLDKLVIGVPDVPIGRYTAHILSLANKTLGADFSSKFEKKVASRELDVRQVLAKVSLGEADAGIVYRTDANTAQDKLSIVTIPADLNVMAEYPIAVVAAAPQPVPAGEWVKFVLSPAGQELLGKAGFIAPAAAGGS
ncbi:MAG: molybdate ABC transporter substrate-binding protein [Deltaproteobacteria bacterium]